MIVYAFFVRTVIIPNKISISFRPFFIKESEGISQSSFSDSALPEDSTSKQKDPFELFSFVSRMT